MIIAIVGKTSSGKDSLAKYIKEYYDIPAIVSYTTRPKRESETNGIEHWFISKEEMAELLKIENIIHTATTSKSKPQRNIGQK